jgi:hypothetical protein
MASIPVSNTRKQSSCEQSTKNINEASNFDISRIQNENLFRDSSYSIVLIFNALVSLACDHALVADANVDYLVTKALLESSLTIAELSLDVVEDEIRRDYQWLLNVLDNNNQ